MGKEGIGIGIGIGIWRLASTSVCWQTHVVYRHEFDGGPPHGQKKASASTLEFGGLHPHLLVGKLMSCIAMSLTGGPNDKVGKKVQFGAFWSSFGPRMDSTCMEQGGWMFLKFKRLGMCCKDEENKVKTKKIRNQLKRRNIIQNLILSYPNLILPYL
ncbi:hypothetical protein DVH24_035498 [Malus domestica]|uniref:Uncharacterized protein n=1 Tax=Malus domestica TaxID=3750 RepID=A0A498J9C6_MALDO|nr:hypothetical protein DVH24_035498 [Malus domestica]